MRPLPKEAGIFLLFLLVVHLLYHPTWNAGFVTDFTGLQSRLEGSSAQGILNSFGFPANQQFLNAILFLFYEAFGIRPLPWYLLFTGLHAGNGLLVFGFGRALFRQFDLSQAGNIAFIGALFFLLSPYQSEVVTWRVCLNFLLSTALISGALWLTLRWWNGGNWKQLWAIHGLFILGLFTFELAMALPFMSLALLLLLPSREKAGQGLKKLFAVQAALLGGYLLLNRWTIGGWVGHYGAEVHLRFELGDILSNYLLYGAKLLAFTRYFPHPIKEGLAAWLKTPELLYPLSIVLGGALILALAWFRRWRGRWQASLLLILLFILALAPAINLYFNYLLHIENDRYGYLASVFFFLALSGTLAALPRPVYYPLAVGFIVISSLLLWRTNQYWATSTKIYYSLLEGFNWYGAPMVYLLNLPDNYQGAVLFRDYSGQGQSFPDALKYIKRQPYEGKLFEVAQYNMAKPENGVSVQRDTTGQIKVEFLQWGTWWWRNGIGMGGGYETEAYSVTSHGKFYLLDFKEQLAEEAVFLYQIGGEWQVLKL